MPLRDEAWVLTRDLETGKVVKMTRWGTVIDGVQTEETFDPRPEPGCGA